MKKSVTHKITAIRMGLDLIQENRRMHLALPSNTKTKAQGGGGTVAEDRNKTQNDRNTFQKLEEPMSKRVFFFLC